MTDASVPTAWPAISLAAATAALTAPGMPHEMDEVVIGGIPTRIWKNGPQTLKAIFLQGRAHGGKVFLVHEDERVTFEAFARASLAFAASLQGHGVRKGDRVAIVMRNLPEWPVAFFGAVLAGAIATPLNAWWTADEIAYGLADSGARIVVLDAERHQRLGGVLPDLATLEHVIVSRLADSVAPAGVARLEDLIGRPAEWDGLPEGAMPDVVIEPDDPASIMYTSGTTGRPKGALQSHRNACCSTSAASYGQARNFLRRGEAIPAPDPSMQRASLIGIPFFHTTGCHAMLCPALFAGSKIVMMRRWDAVEGMKLIERERITAAGGVPTIAWQIVEHPDRERYDLSSLELVSYGGAPAASELVRRIKQVFPKSHPGNGWGMTETSATFSHHSAEDYVNRPESCGPAIPVCDMAIMDDDWRELPVGEIGELVVKGPNVVAGYWNQPEANQRLFRDGWFRTGDLARIDDEGFLFIVDRKKDMLIRGGENIYCVEVEDALCRHEAVMDAALVGLPHRLLGEEPAAFVSIKPGSTTTEAELKAFVAERLAAFKVPVRIVLRDEPLPRNPNGKILKKELRAELLAEMAA
jgi:long-chain acyl-CoA synthetase